MNPFDKFEDSRTEKQKLEDKKEFDRAVGIDKDAFGLFDDALYSSPSAKKESEFDKVFKETTIPSNERKDVSGAQKQAPSQEQEGTTLPRKENIKPPKNFYENNRAEIKAFINEVLGEKKPKDKKEAPLWRS